MCHNNYVHLRMILMRLLTADYSMLLTIRRYWPTIQLIQQMIVIGCRLIYKISSHDERVAIHFNVDTCEVMHMGFNNACSNNMMEYRFIMLLNNRTLLEVITTKDFGKQSSAAVGPTKAYDQ